MSYLDKVEWFLRVFVVFPHDVGVHEGLSPEQTEAAGAAQDAPHDVLCRLLEPMADGVLEHLVPHHESGPSRQDPEKRHIFCLVFVAVVIVY